MIYSPINNWDRSYPPDIILYHDDDFHNDDDDDNDNNDFQIFSVVDFRFMVFKINILVISVS